ncbi:MAG: recombinase family protein [Chloroflexi bacterium]|nr:recombinase family protein [Chloroflexota bacterium]
MRAAIYTRVSTEEPTEGRSLDAQKDECVSLLKRRGWQYMEPDYLEPGRSLKTDLRPVFQRMIRDAELRRFDVIVVQIERTRMLCLIPKTPKVYT